MLINEVVQPVSDNFIEIRDLHVGFHTRDGLVRALRGVSFDIKKSEALGVIGESGCGKSVTAQAVLRIIPHPGRIEQGSITIKRKLKGVEQEVDLTKVNPTGPEIRSVRGKEISVIFQEPMTSLSPVHTVGSQIIEAIRLHNPVTKREARERAIELLDLVGIPRPERRIDTYTFELSGGMRQRCMIAMALSCKPQMLIADEPTTALDVTIQAQILELMQKLQQELSMAILFITHNLGVVAKITDRVVVMYLGRVVESGTKRDIFKNPKHPYTLGLLKSIPQVGMKTNQRLWAIKGVVPSPYAQVPGCTFHPRCPSFMPDVCNKKVPEINDIGNGQAVACFLHSGGEK